VNFKSILLLFLCVFPTILFCVAREQEKKPAASWQRRFAGGLGGLLGIGFGYSAMGAVRSYQQGESPSNTTIAAGTATIVVGGLDLWSWAWMRRLWNAEAKFAKAEKELQKTKDLLNFTSDKERQQEQEMRNIATDSRFWEKFPEKARQSQSPEAEYQAILAWNEKRNEKAKAIFKKLNRQEQASIEEKIKTYSDNFSGCYSCYNGVSGSSRLAKLKRILDILLQSPLCSSEDLKKEAKEEFIRTGVILETVLLDKEQAENAAGKKLKIVQVNKPLIAELVYGIFEPVTGAFAVGAGLGAGARAAGATVNIGNSERTFGFNWGK